MTNIMTLNTEKAVSNPEAVFDTPAALVGHIGLTRGQKNSALERWTFNVRARVDALSEGMMNHPGGTYSKDVELVRVLEKAALELKEQA